MDIQLPEILCVKYIMNSYNSIVIKKRTQLKTGKRSELTFELTR